MSLESPSMLEPYGDEFSEVVKRLKLQGALPVDSFLNEIPFFNISLVSKEAQVKGLFQVGTDKILYEALLKGICNQQREETTNANLSNLLIRRQVMTFAQIVLYKVLPCPDLSCPSKPRQIATHNEYKDYEYECPFYHHDRDQRRPVITPFIDDEFVYKANYYEEGKRNVEKNRYSQNYFESMFHPLYYKMFKCKREFCQRSHCCPFFHNEEEKKLWDESFSDFIKKDRISYVKDKQKYYEYGVEGKRVRSFPHNSEKLTGRYHNFYQYEENYENPKITFQQKKREYNGQNFFEEEEFSRPYSGLGRGFPTSTAF
jgi:hypothetical protein